MKKTNKVHPLTFFREKNEARNKSFNKSLPRADEGRAMGPMTQQEAAQAAFSSPQNDPVNNTPIPYANPGPVIKSSRPTVINPIDAMGDDAQRMSNGDKGQYNSGAMQATSRRVNSAPYEQKKGGVVNRIGGVKKNASKKK
jgi:hypothetical protein